MSLKLGLVISILLHLQMLSGMTLAGIAQASMINPDPETQNDLVRSEFNDPAGTLRQNLTIEVNTQAPPLCCGTLWNGTGPPNPGTVQATTDGNGYIRILDAKGPQTSCCGNMDCGNMLHAPNFVIAPEFGVPGNGTDILVWEFWVRFNAITQTPLFPRAWMGYMDFEQTGPDHDLMTHGWILGTGTILGAGGMHTNDIGVGIFPVGPTGYNTAMAEFSGALFIDGQDIGLRIILIPGPGPVGLECTSELRYEYNLTGSGPDTGEWTEFLPSGPNSAIMTSQRCKDTSAVTNHVGVLSVRTSNTECGDPTEEVLLNHMSIYQAQLNPGGPTTAVIHWPIYAD